MGSINEHKNILKRNENKEPLRLEVLSNKVDCKIANIITGENYDSWFDLSDRMQDFLTVMSELEKKKILIVHFLREGKSYARIMRDFSVSKSLISKIKKEHNITK